MRRVDACQRQRRIVSVYHHDCCAQALLHSALATAHGSVEKLDSPAMLHSAYHAQSALSSPWTLATSLGINIRHINTVQIKDTGARVQIVLLC